MGRPIKTTFTLTEDLSAAVMLNKAISFVDGKIAEHGLEAHGLLQECVDTASAVVGVIGELNFVAGAGVTAGDLLTVESGWCVAAAVGTGAVGTAKADVASGSTGVGFFNFTTPSSIMA